MHQIMVQFGDVVPFLTNPDLVSPATCSHLLEIVQSTQQYHLLRVELAAVVDAGEMIAKSTYRLEGDGPLVFQAYKEIATVRAAVWSAHYPNVLACYMADCEWGFKLAAAFADLRTLQNAFVQGYST